MNFYEVQNVCTQVHTFCTSVEVQTLTHHKAEAQIHLEPQVCVCTAQVWQRKLTLQL